MNATKVCPTDINARATPRNILRVSL